MITHSKLSKLKKKLFPTSLHGNYRDCFGEFNSTSYVVFEAERVKVFSNLCFRSLDVFTRLHVSTSGTIEDNGDGFLQVRKMQRVRGLIS